MKSFTLMKNALMFVALLLGSTAFAETVVFAENFSKFSGGLPVTSGGGTGTEVTTTLDNYTTLSGWSGAKVYQSGKFVKMGTSGTAGWLQTPPIDLSGNGGAFTISFQASNWAGQSGMIVTVNGTDYSVAVTSVSSTETAPAASFPVYTVAATGGTSATVIKFSSTNTRFLMGDLKITQTAAVGPTLTVPDSFGFGSIKKGETSNKEINVVGLNLTGDLTVGVVGDGFQCPTTTITKEQAAAGKNLSVSFNPTEYKSYTGTITISGGGITTPKVLSLTGKGVKLDAANIAELRSFDSNGTTVYTLTGKSIVTFASTVRSAKYIKDESGSILIDDSGSKITTAFSVGDEISSIQGTLSPYNGMLQFIPTTDAIKGESGKTVVPETVTLAELTTNHQAKLVKVPKVTFAMVDSKDVSVSAFAVSTSYKLVGSDVVVRTQYSDLNYIGQNIPSTEQDLTAEVLVYNSTIQLIPRSLGDFVNHSSTGIATEKVNAGIYANNDKVYVPAVVGEKIIVTNSLGQTISVSAAHDGVNELSNLPQKQLLIVKVGSKVAKVIL